MTAACYFLNWCMQVIWCFIGLFFSFIWISNCFPFSLRIIPWKSFGDLSFWRFIIFSHQEIPWFFYATSKSWRKENLHISVIRDGLFRFFGQGLWQLRFVFFNSTNKRNKHDWIIVPTMFGIWNNENKLSLICVLIGDLLNRLIYLSIVTQLPIIT